MLLTIAGVSCTGAQAGAGARDTSGARGGVLSKERSHEAVCDGAPCRVTVELAGNRKVPSADVFSIMRILVEHDFEDDVLERDMLVVNSYYYDRGYLSVTIPAPAVAWSDDRREVRITLSIHEGPQYRLKGIQVYEDRDKLRCPPMGGWPSSLHQGDVFNRAEMAYSLTQLQRVYRDQGYADVAATPQTTLDEERHEVSLTVPVVRGPVVHFGRIQFVGLETIADADVRKRIDVAEGERFSETGLLRSKAHLLETGLFESVDVSTENGAAPGLINIHFEVEEKKQPGAAVQPRRGNKDIHRTELASWGSFQLGTDKALSPAKALEGAGPKAVQSEDDTRGCYAIPAPLRITAKHILVTFATAEKHVPGVKRSRDQARKLAEEALARVRAGEDFDAMVDHYSDEPGASDVHGSLGEFGPDDMLEPFSKTAFGLQISEISDIVETKYGFHIILRTQ